MASKLAVDAIETSTKVHFSGFHLDSARSNHMAASAEEEEEEQQHGQPFVIGERCC